MFKIKSLLLLVLSVVASVAFAQEEEKPGLEISGAVDLYYRYDFAKQGSGINLGKDVNGDDVITNNFPTSFAGDHNSFSLGMANIIFSQDFGKVGFVADLAVGPRAVAANGGTADAEDGNGNTFGTFISGTSSLIKQLYVTYDVSESVTLTAGNFSTFVGYELIDANGNFNYTTSYLFSNGPFYHTGLKADFSLGGGLSAMVGVFNQTDSKMNAGTDPKYVGAQVGYAPEDGALALYLNGLYGEDGEMAQTVVDLTGTFQATDALMIGLNASYNQQVKYPMNNPDKINEGFAGVAGYVNYSISDAVALGVRGEHFIKYDADANDATKQGSSAINAFTLSANISEGPLTIVPEFRIDMGDKAFYDGGSSSTIDAATGTTTVEANMVDNATSVVLAAYYSF